MINQNNLPMGFAFMLAQHPEAMKTFSNLPEHEQAKILQQAHSVANEQEMQSLVNSLSAER